MSFGQVNADVIGTSVAGSNLGAGNASIMKNRIINGAMVIDQRNAGASFTNTAGAGYTLDRWAYYGDQASKFTVQQNAGSVTPPAGFVNYLGVTSLSSYSVPAGEIYRITQPIEGYNTADLNWGTINAKTVTLSFWVRSSLTGTFGGSLINSTAGYNYPFAYTISSANTWQQISITIAGPTSGTWQSTTSTGINVIFGLGVGSTYSATAGTWTTTIINSSTGATSVVGTNGATFYITGVQLEVSSSATGFEYRQYGQELALCQRYYQQINAGTSQNYTAFGSGFAANSTIASVYLKYATTVRATPTFTQSNTGLNAYIGQLAVTGISAIYAGLDSAFLNLITSGASSGLTVLWNANNNSAAYLSLSAEL